jgi:glycosyltransferase involved in cell wall biosynthesis
MKIAQISPLYESVPPKLYGGTERVVHYLTEELVAQGHDVTLFASGDSVTNARLIAAHPRALRLDKNCIDKFAPHFAMMEVVEKESHNFDIIHSHIDYLYYPLLRRSNFSHITTLHGRLDLPELNSLYQEFNDIPLVSISDSQRCPVSFANWEATVYHGLPFDLLNLKEEPGQYLAFVGRISPEKRVDRAIEVAIKSGIPIRIAAKVDRVDQEYFDAEIKHLLNHPLVEFLGEVNDAQKQELLQNAMALLFLIDWPEPFGLAMIEAMACGTPVIAYAHGSVPEIIDEGLTGFIVNSQEEALKAIENLALVNRKKCRQIFDTRFSAQRMAKDYIEVYQRLINKKNIKILNHKEQIGINILENSSLYGTTISNG